MVNATRWFVTIAVLALSAFQATASGQSPPASERAAVYRTFLTGYLEGHSANVGDQTYRLAITNRDLGACGEGLSFDLAAAETAATHDLHEELSGVTSVRLVNAEAQRAAVRENDPSAGIRRGLSTDDAVDAAFDAALLTLSEVAFDESGRYAILEYGFTCGALCGNGGVVLLENTEADGWRMSSRRCAGSWIS